MHKLVYNTPYWTLRTQPYFRITLISKGSTAPTTEVETIAFQEVTLNMLPSFSSYFEILIFLDFVLPGITQANFFRE